MFKVSANQSHQSCLSYCSSGHTHVLSKTQREGGGFAGFWYQLGLLQAIPDLSNHHYYCYSSGCLSKSILKQVYLLDDRLCSKVLATGLAVAFMGMTLEDTFRSASGAKNMWLQRQISLYKIVDYFLDDILDHRREIDPTFLDRLNVLISTSDGGTIVRKATSLEELKDLMLKTVYM